MIKIDFSRFPREIMTPAVVAESDQFMMRLAETEEEIAKALRLRYEVFNVEQGKGLERSKELGIDVDEFDEYCIQLLLIEKASGKAIGTYRVHLGSVATKGMGFYSATEYELEGLDSIAHLSMEVGRSCVALEYRKGSGVSLLWGGLGELMMRAKLRYLFGCVSLDVVDPASAWALYDHLKQDGKISSQLKAIPKPGYVMERPAQAEIDAVLTDKARLRAAMPPLLKGYIRLGAHICGEPVHDKAFGTVDYFILLDSAKASERYTRHYGYQYEAK